MSLIDSEFDLDAIIMEDRDCGDFLEELRQSVDMDIEDEDNDNDEKEYQRKLDEQKRLREEYLAFKARRRRESAAEHEFNASLALKQIQGMRGELSPKPKKLRPLTRLDNNSITIRRTVRSDNSHFGSNLIDMKPPKKLFADENRSENSRFGATTVIIKNLSPDINEYRIKDLGDSVGTVVGVCVALEAGVRKGMVRFASPVDALLFQRKFDNYRLGSSMIRTTLMN